MDRESERLEIEVLYYSNLNPIPTVIKDFMASSVWTNGEQFEFQKSRRPRFTHKIKNETTQNVV